MLLPMGAAATQSAPLPLRVPAARGARRRRPAVGTTGSRSERRLFTLQRFMLHRQAQGAPSSASLIKRCRDEENVKPTTTAARADVPVQRRSFLAEQITPGSNGEPLSPVRGRAAGRVVVLPTRRVRANTGSRRPGKTRSPPRNRQRRGKDKATVVQHKETAQATQVPRPLLRLSRRVAQDSGVLIRCAVHHGRREGMRERDMRVQNVVRRHDKTENGDRGAKQKQCGTERHQNAP